MRGRGSTDRISCCGSEYFDTISGVSKIKQARRVDADIAFKKLAALVEGAELASRRLWA